jgi:hypothetical protein
MNYPLLCRSLGINDLGPKSHLIFDSKEFTSKIFITNDLGDFPAFWSLFAAASLSRRCGSGLSSSN